MEYDLSFLQNKLALSLSDSQYNSDNDKYLDERMKALIKGGLFPVIYTSSRVNIPFTKLKKFTGDDSGKIINDNEINEIIYKSYIIKSSNWSYENEWRLILDGNICDYYDYKIPFPYIKKVYLGCKMDLKTKETMKEICNKLGVDIVPMEMDNKKFCLNQSYLSEYRDIMKKYNNPFCR